MTKIPVKTRIPIQMWTVAVLVTLFSLISSVIQGPAATDTSVFHAKLANPTITSAIR